MKSLQSFHILASSIHNPTARSKPSTSRTGKSRRLMGMLAMLSVGAAGTAANAATKTWDGVGGSTWDTTTTSNWTGATWSAGDDAIFGASGVGTISVAAGGVTAHNLTFNTTGYTVQSNTLTLGGTAPTVTVGSGVTATINSVIAGTVGLSAEGGGILNLGGANTVLCGATAANPGVVVGSTSGYNTLNISNGGTIASTSSSNSQNRGLLIGGSTFGNNSMNVSTTGTQAAPSFVINNVNQNLNWVQIGVSSSNNSLNISNGAYFGISNDGNGVAASSSWNLGVNSGANNNSITVSGAGSVFNRVDNSGRTGVAAASALNIGVAGNGNSVVVSAGGTFKPRRLYIGSNGGSNNFLQVTGAGSQAIFTEPTTGANSIFEIGSTSTSNGNYVSVEAGGYLEYTGKGNNSGSGFIRGFTIGRAGDNNYMAVTGTNSLVNINNGQPVALGGVTQLTNSVTDGGTGNHLDINNGGAVDLTFAGTGNGGSATSSLYVLGSTSTGNTSVNLGNGTGIGTLTVGANGGSWVAGVYLKNASGRLNFNGGRLIAGANGALVSGLGSIVLNGPAYISTGFAGSTISTAISGTGSLTKEGTGTLTLQAASTHNGTTTIKAGTLALGASGSIANSPTIIVGDAGSSGAVLDVTAVGAFTVGASQTVKGIGSIAGNVATAAATTVIAPGNSAGTLTFSNNLNLAAGGTFQMELGSAATPGTTYDKVAIGGVFTGSTNALDINFEFTNLGGLQTNTPYTLLAFGSSSGLDYGDLEATVLPGVYSLDSSFGTGGWLIDGTSLQVQFTAVPEPTGAVLVVAGLLCMVVRRR